MRSMQKASPSTNAKATSDMKPALPSMNFTLSDWCSPMLSSVSARSKPGLGNGTASVSGMAFAVSLGCTCALTLSAGFALRGVGVLLLPCACSWAVAAKSNRPMNNKWLNLCLIDVISCQRII